MIPYEGREPYIFVSYAHKDSDIVLSIIEAMSEHGFRIWYDAGIEAGTEWPEYIAERLDESAVVIAFLSEHSLKSVNCRQEINEAISAEKDLLVVYLHELNLTKGMRMRLNLTQAMFMHRHSNMESFYNSLFNAKILRPCLSEREQVAEQSVTEVIPETKEEPEALPESTPDDFVISQDVLISYKGKGGVVVVPQGVKNLGYDMMGYGLCEIATPGFKNGFQKTNEITEVVIPEGVEGIGYRTFAYCENLVRVHLPKSLRYIDDFAFYRCFQLQEVTIPQDSQLESIGTSAFENCGSLIKLKLPKRMTSIGRDAFRACRNLSHVSISLDAKLDRVQEDTFHNCSGLEEVTLPNSVVTIEPRAFYGCESLWDINIPNSLKEIKESAFKNCEKLELVDCGWHSSLENIEKEAFKGCRSLKTLRFSDTLKTIDEDAFAECMSLADVEVPKKTKMPAFKPVFPKYTAVKRV